ncbi:MAG: TetR/AcrR family transcriptional regulator [Chloroflexota bacterium]|nr:TetR/AcrR family transcriptional regulator [Chloroflexota bacterium]
MREQLIATTAALLEAQGYHATGLNQILKESGAPKGSLYYYFPAGKEELAAAAVDHSGTLVAARIASALADDLDPALAIPAFVRTIAHYIEAADFRAGGPLLAVALETVASSDRLNQACRAAYDRIEAAFAAKLVAGGYSPARAVHVAQFITATIEGGTVLSRTYHSGDILRRNADELAAFLRTTAKE